VTNGAVVVQASAKLKKLQYVARDAIRALREPERVTDVDIFGRFTLAPDEPLDDDTIAEIMQFVRLARDTFPQQELDVSVIARHASIETS
jgi:hypothetical protein